MVRFLNLLVKRRELVTLGLLIMLVVAVTIREPRFLQPSSINSVIQWLPLLIIVGMGQMLVIVTRGVDVSVGSIMGLSGMVAGILFRDHPQLPVLLATVVGMLTGLVLGCLNGALISKANVPPIIATLGTLSAYRGLVFIISGGKQIDSNSIPDAVTNWSLNGPVQLGEVNFPWILVMALVVAGGMAWFVGMTRSGRNVFAIGSNPKAALLRGVPVNKTIFLVYAVCGLLSGLAGVLYASRYGFVNPGTAGSGFELVVIAAVVIGGTNVVGGSGSVLGVLLGALLLGCVNVALAVLGIDATWQQLVYGVIVLAALVVDTLIRKYATKQSAGASR